MFDAQQNTNLLFAFRNQRVDLDSVLSRLYIDCAAGAVHWKADAISSAHIGEAGTVIRGERVITFEGTKLTAAELVWTHAKGQLPEGPVVYSDGDVTNPALSNLYLKELIQCPSDVPYGLRRTTKDADALNAKRCLKADIPASSHYDAVFDLHRAFAFGKGGIILDIWDGGKPAQITEADGLLYVNHDDELVEAADVVIALTEGVLPEFVLFMDGNPANLKRSNLLFVEAE